MVLMAMVVVALAAIEKRWVQGMVSRGCPGTLAPMG